MAFHRRSEPTLSTLKFVGRVLTWGWIARSLVSLLHALLTVDLHRDGCPLQGDLSDWVERLEKHPFAAFGCRGSGWRGVMGVWYCSQLLWKLHQLDSAKEVIYQAQKLLPAKDLTELEDFWRIRDFAGLNVRCQKILERTAPNWRLNVLECLETLRAAQVTFRSLASCKTNPIYLIERARQGDQDAALDLIRLDKLFLTDACTREVLRKATFEDDSGFSARLAAAIEYKAEFTRRHAFQVYLYGLFALGIELPKIFELHTTLDPEGTEFPGDYGFERYVERRRKDLAFRAIASDS
jgi:hypothetical protein